MSAVEAEYNRLYREVLRLTDEGEGAAYLGDDEQAAALAAQASLVVQGPYQAARVAYTASMKGYFPWVA